MSKTIHVIQAEFKNPRAKSRLMFCSTCEVMTMHVTPFFGFPFRCVTNHGGVTRCDGCDTFVDFIAKVIVIGQFERKSYCSLCLEPDSKEKQDELAQRKRKNREAAEKPDLYNPESIARALGASVWTKK